MRIGTLVVLAALAVAGCVGELGSADGRGRADAAATPDDGDAGEASDSGAPMADVDATVISPTPDGESDAGITVPGMDAGPLAPDAGTDSGPPDSGPPDSGPADSGPADSGPADSGPPDSGPRDSGPPPTTGGLGAILSRTAYESMFPQRNALYSYDALVAAAAFYPGFASEGSDEARRREVAAFLSNIGHETTGGWDTAPGGRYAWGLYFIQEVGCESGACTGYCAPSAEYPCAPGRTYHGRGPMQLSYNYNYGPMGRELGVDLLSNPDLVTSDGIIAFRSALWFWMTPQAPKPSAHDVMIGRWSPTEADRAAGRAPGFGMTVVIINGGLECGHGADARVADRLGFYERTTSMLGVSQGANVDCGSMRPY